MQDGFSRLGGKILSLRTTVCLTFLNKFSGRNFQQPQIKNSYNYIFFAYFFYFCYFVLFSLKNASFH